MASKHVGSQLIELSLSDKDFIAVSEEVSCRIVSWTGYLVKELRFRDSVGFSYY